MGILDGQLAKALFAGFKGKLLKGTLRRLIPSQSGGLDGLGDEIAPTPTTWPCEGFTDDYSDEFKARYGIPETDLKVCIFAQSIAAGSISPQKDDQVQIPAGTGPWYQLRKAKTDPATALWTCQAYGIRAPS